MDQEEEIKIAIMGMENAGKTTIVKLLAFDKPPQNAPQMTPTKGIKRNRSTLFNRKVTIWDFGGQEVYRNEYIESPEKYFPEISLFYYVVDVQDPYRVFPSVIYFTVIFNLIKKYSPEAKLILLFHKMDPYFDPTIRNLKKTFLKRIELTLGTHEINYQIYDTTIFNLKSIRVAFKDEL